MPDQDDYDAGPLWDTLGNPDGVAYCWLEGWLLGSNVGLPDLYAYSRVVWTVKETGKSFPLDFAQLKGQPILTASVLADHVRRNLETFLPPIRTHTSLLGNALAHLARDFESLLAAGRAPDSGVVMLRAYSRAVRQAWTLLLDDARQFGSRDGAATVSGWSRLAPVARGLALATAEDRGLTADRIPTAAAVSDSFADFDAYCGALLDALALVPASEAPTDVEPSAVAAAAPRPEWITQRPPEDVRVDCALLAEELRIEGKSVRRASLPASVWTLLAKRLAGVAAEWSSSKGAVEHRFIPAGVLRVEARGRFQTELREWWRDVVGPGDPLTPSGTKGVFLVGFRFRVAPDSQD